MTEPLLPSLEEKVLAFWLREGTFRKSLAKPSPQGRFVFYEGPPYANGLPGIHHMLARAYKDAIARYRTMRGYHVLRRAGWDTHGLPTEMAVEKELGLKSKREIEETVGVERFVAACRENVFTYKAEWEKFTERMGYWVDLAAAYVTMTNDYIESVWWAFAEIAKRGLLYQDFKVVPLCTRCGTALSSHEMAQGYQSVTENSVYLKFELVDEPGTFVLAWTTTPWTLPGNVALAVGPEVPYVLTELGGGKYLVAEARQSVIGPDAKVLRRLPGHELIGKKYRPLFDFLDLGQVSGRRAYEIVAGDFVSTEEGTGIVHTAVMYGADDFRLGTRLDLPKVHTVNPDGTFNDLVKPWAGKSVKDPMVERAIVDYLHENNRLYREEDYTHDYPFCWRCETPLLYYAKNSWFLKTTAVKEAMIKANQGINWVPSYLKEGRFGEWLEKVVDWAISRERYWGVPLPIWVCEGHGAQGLGRREGGSSTHHLPAGQAGSPPATHQLVIGSYAELRQYATKPLPDPFDPHRPWIDAVVLKCPECGGEMRRVAEVADVWFDSGCMPFAQWHYPFTNREKIDQGEQYPADFIAEGIDQTRGWFYTLLAVATLLGRPAPYKSVVSLGLVNDAQGKKMSKSKGNLILPDDLIPKFGADPVRFYLFTVSQAGDFKNFDPRGVEAVVRKTFLILLNVLSFMQLYRAEPLTDRPPPSNELLDRWLAAALADTVRRSTAAYERYDLTTAGRTIASFVTDLSTWYLRRSRQRFREPGERRVVAAAYLSWALRETAKLLAPLAPFTAEHVYREVGRTKLSVHLEDWPSPSPAVDPRPLRLMATIRAVVEAGHALRKHAKLKVRQPLPQFVVAGSALPPEASAIIADELNVKEVHRVKSVDQLPSGVEWVRTVADAAPVAPGIPAVALDTTVTDELRFEGLKREFIRRLNALRKTRRLTLADRIVIRLATNSDLLRGLVERHGEALKRELRADRIDLEATVEGPGETIEGESFRVALEPVDHGTA